MLFSTFSKNEWEWFWPYSVKPWNSQRGSIDTWFFSVTPVYSRDREGICARNLMISSVGAPTSELKIKYIDGEPMTSVCFTPCENASQTLKGQSPMLNWVASPWLMKDNFIVPLSFLPYLRKKGKQFQAETLLATPTQMYSAFH